MKTMKTSFLTLLAAIASLSAHTLVEQVQYRGDFIEHLLPLPKYCIPHWEFGSQVPEQRDVGRRQFLFFMLIVVSPNTSRHTKEGTQSFLIMPLRKDSTSES
ncbi:hypothetical protein BDN67DRAFT_1006404 [Paxillus ammoniavirescens]|nr:hypothetical protein BDN67DRAFT_1006404 [Paxillus ammoniavirescens]